jgi:hypothetical protein
MSIHSDRTRDMLLNPELLIPPRPTISNMQWISGTQHVTVADMDLLSTLPTHCYPFPANIPQSVVPIVHRPNACSPNSAPKPSKRVAQHELQQMLELDHPALIHHIPHRPRQRTRAGVHGHHVSSMSERRSWVRWVTAWIRCSRIVPDGLLM